MKTGRGERAEQQISRATDLEKAEGRNGLLAGGSVEAEGFAFGAAEGDDFEAVLELRTGRRAGPEAGLRIAFAPPWQLNGVGVSEVRDEAADHFLLADEASGFGGHSAPDSVSGEWGRQTKKPGTGPGFQGSNKAAGRPTRAGL